MSSVLPEMQRYMVEVKGWMTATEFMRCSRWRRRRPGQRADVQPGRLEVGGFAGSLVALGAMCGPAAVLAWWVSDLLGPVPRFTVAQADPALARATGGRLVLAGGYVIATPAARLASVLIAARAPLECWRHA